MINSKLRQEKIKSILLTAKQPISANFFAKQFKVSRQTIVGDIALLRAHGEIILATPTGYEYKQPDDLKFTVVCQHDLNQTSQEMLTIIRDGGTILDVSVDHPLYGQLSGQLTVRSEADVKQFMYHLKQFKGHLLSEITDGIHSHDIAVDNSEQIEKIRQDLRDIGVLYE